MVLAKSLATGPPSLAAEANLAYLTSLRSLGTIQLDQSQKEAALVLFREEIKIREQFVRVRPYDADAKIELAEAYAYASKCLDLTGETSRSLAIFYLEQSIDLIGKVPYDLRSRKDVQDKLTGFKTSLFAIQTR